MFLLCCLLSVMWTGHSGGLGKVRWGGPPVLVSTHTFHFVCFWPAGQTLVPFLTSMHGRHSRGECGVYFCLLQRCTNPDVYFVLIGQRSFQSHVTSHYIYRVSALLVRMLDLPPMGLPNYGLLVHRYLTDLSLPGSLAFPHADTALTSSSKVHRRSAANGLEDRSGAATKVHDPRGDLCHHRGALEDTLATRVFQATPWGLWFTVLWWMGTNHHTKTRTLFSSLWCNVCIFFFFFWFCWPDIVFKRC